MVTLMLPTVMPGIKKLISGYAHVLLFGWIQQAELYNRQPEFNDRLHQP